MTWALILEKGIPAALGALGALGLAYIAVGHKLSYIQGCMVSLMKAADEGQKLTVAHALLAREMEIAKKDIGAAHLKLRDLGKRRPL